jgi:hypothetical protein
VVEVVVEVVVVVDVVVEVVVDDCTALCKITLFNSNTTFFIVFAAVSQNAA